MLSYSSSALSNLLMRGAVRLTLSSVLSFTLMPGWENYLFIWGLPLDFLPE